MDGTMSMEELKWSELEGREDGGWVGGWERGEVDGWREWEGRRNPPLLNWDGGVRGVPP